LSINEELSNGKLLAYYRQLNGDRFLVLLNFSKQVLKLKNVEGTTLISTYLQSGEDELKPFEGRVLKLD
jgi:hypothetical protein